MSRMLLALAMLQSFAAAPISPVAFAPPETSTTWARYNVAETLAAGVGGRREALSLAAGDLDGDGMPDLVVSLGTPEGRGEIVVFPGNVDYLFPNQPGTQERRTAGLLVDRPFLLPWPAFALESPAPFLFVADFDADGRVEVLAAAPGASHLEFLRPMPSGLSQPAERLALSGSLTALAVGEVGRRDGYDEIVAAVVEDEGAMLVVLSPGRGDAERRALAAPASALALGRLDGDRLHDVAALLGDRVEVYSGGDAAFDGARLAVRSRWWSLDQPGVALLVADLVAEEDDRRIELAVIDVAGDLAILDLDAEVAGSPLDRDALPTLGARPVRPDAAPLAIAARLAVAPTRAVLASAGPDGLVAISSRRSGGIQRLAAATTAPIVAALPLRLNVDAMDDLVFLLAGSPDPVVVTSAPRATFQVHNTDTLSDCHVGDGVCSTDTGDGCGTGGCTLLAALQEAAAQPGPDLVTFFIGGGNPAVAIPGNPSGYGVVAGTTVDGTTQPGYAGTPLVWLAGDGTSWTRTGIMTSDDANVIRGIGVYGMSDVGLGSCNGTGDILEGNFAGAKTGGQLGNQVGIMVTGCNFGQTWETRVGGTVAAARNLAGGNVWIDFAAGGRGCTAYAHDMVVEGNWFGVDELGALPAAPATPAEHNAGLSQFHGGTFGGVAGGAGNRLAGASNVGRGALSLFDSCFPADDLIIAGNRIGLTPSDSVTGTAGDGILVMGTNDLVTIGVPGAGNEIGGAGRHGINFSTRVTNVVVQANTIGEIGGAAAGNAGFGIYVDNWTDPLPVGAPKILIGGTGHGEGNLVAHNGGSGIYLFQGLRTTIRGNEVWDHPGGLAIDLDCWPFGACAGVNANDAGDADGCGQGCPNHFQNFPEVTEAETDRVHGFLDSAALQSYDLDFFASPGCHHSGHGPMALYLGSASVTTNATGRATFSAPVATIPGGWVVSATATDEDGNSSEAGPCVDLIFADRFVVGSLP